MVSASEIRIGLPPWAWTVDGADRALPSVEARMDLVLELLERNIADGGGPFAAAIFDEAGRLVAPGVNRVVDDANPTAHAEIVTIAAAGQVRGTWDLAASGRHQLVTSTEPCAMCLGAVPWSGVTSLVTGARDGDARAIGFDEGDKPADWAAALAARGIEVIRDVRRREVKELLGSLPGIRSPDLQRLRRRRSMIHRVQQLGTEVARIVSPGTLTEAIEALARPRSRPIAGGTDLLIELERGEHDGLETLVDLSRVAGLDSIEEADGRITIGPLVTHAKALGHPILQRHAVPLVQACREVGSPQLRNRATIAGNVVTASPANDTVSALLALDAAVHLQSVTGERTVPLDQFQVGLRRTVRADDELVVGLSFPTPSARTRGIFVKLGNRRAQAISVVHVAAVAELADGAGPAPVVERLRLALGSVAPAVIRDGRVEALVEGRTLDDDLIAEAGVLAAGSVEPIDDLRATADYRRAMVEQLTVRALRALRDDTGVVDADPVLLWGDGEGAWPTGPSWSTSHDATTPVTARVNGSTIASPGATGRLLDWLRDAGLTGTKEGCAEGECGSCTVHLDGLAVLSCLVPASRAEGAEIVTVEGLGQLSEPERPLHRLQEAFVQAGAVQCGYCIPGFLVAGAKLLEERPDPSEADIVDGLAGNLCRCTGYYKIVEAMTAPGGDSGRAAGPERADDR